MVVVVVVVELIGWRWTSGVGLWPLTVQLPRAVFWEVVIATVGVAAATADATTATILVLLCFFDAEAC